ncbi:MAG: hypothetical protein AB7Q27_18730 [Acidimicrobiia bacterium]
MNPTRNHRRIALAAVALTATSLLAACGGGTTAQGNGNAAVQTTTNSASNAGAVLPVDTNPITNTATADGLTIDSILVENNVDPVTGKDASDHLEIALTNTGTTELGGFEIYYTFADPKTNITENYYLQLPADFTIPAGGTRTAHFDDTGAPDHFPVNKFSLYYTDTNALDVTVAVSATGVKVQTATITKDEGGAEVAD